VLEFFGGFFGFVFAGCGVGGGSATGGVVCSGTSPSVRGISSGRTTDTVGAWLWRGKPVFSFLPHPCRTRGNTKEPTATNLRTDFMQGLSSFSFSASRTGPESSLYDKHSCLSGARCEARSVTWFPPFATWWWSKPPSLLQSAGEPAEASNETRCPYLSPIRNSATRRATALRGSSSPSRCHYRLSWS